MNSPVSSTTPAGLKWWIRVGGVTQSADGRFYIQPLFNHGTTAYAYTVFDTFSKTKFTSYSQRFAKDWAERNAQNSNGGAS